MPTADGGCIIAGYTYLYESPLGYKAPPSGDKTETGKGGNDYWIIRLNADGLKVWDKIIGGSNDDSDLSIALATNGDIVVVGSSSSAISGDKTQNGRGELDYWIVRLNGAGQKLWDKTFGGTQSEGYPEVISLPTGDFLIAGTSYSSRSGDKSEPTRGVGDIWIVKVGHDGSKLWDKTVGGSHDDNYSGLAAIDNVSFVLAGLSFSDRSGEKSDNHKGGSDCWIVKVSQVCSSMHTIASGDWNANNTWSCSRVPLSTDIVTIKQNHTVRIPANYTATVHSIRYEGGILLSLPPFVSQFELESKPPAGTLQVS